MLTVMYIQWGDLSYGCLMINTLLQTSGKPIPVIKTLVHLSVLLNASIILFRKTRVSTFNKILTKTGKYYLLNADPYCL